MKKIIWILILFLSANVVFAEETAQSVFNELVKKFSAAPSVSFEFALDGNASFRGSLKSKPGNKYVITTSERKIVSNGKNIWNYSIKDNKVILSEQEVGSIGSISVENVFYSFSSTFKPVSLKRENDSKLGTSLVLHLRSDKAQSQLNIETMQLVLDTKTKQIKAVRLDGTDGKQSWTIKKINTTNKIADSAFEFTPPKNCEVIDLR